ncbi:MAG: response regulator [candidate division Zixibacteria bacterium]|nr:response regulator [candidate division Zixibacteria bacterium]
MSQPKILLVDDSRSILNALRRTFALENWDIICAASATEALAALAHAEVDVVISDENMPGMCGSEFLKQVRELYPNVVRMMLTGATDIDVAKRAINQGEISRFFTKPWEDYELLVGVQQALRVKELESENEHLKASVKRQDHLLAELESEYPGIADKRLAADGSIIID